MDYHWNVKGTGIRDFYGDEKKRVYCSGISTLKIVPYLFPSLFCLPGFALFNACHGA
jgi:hypothetical protein